MSFGNILKKIRKDNNLTQEDLARKINTSRSNIANYENNKNMPSIEILEKLSNILNCSTDCLLGKLDAPKVEEDKIKEEFQFAYHKEMEGLTEEEVFDALRFYKKIKYGKEN